MELETLIGWFANSHLLSAQIAPGSRVTDLPEQVREAVLEASLHQFLPTALLWRDILRGINNPERLDNPNHEAHIFFEFVNEPHKLPMKDLVIEPFSLSGMQMTAVPFYVFGGVSDCRLSIAVRYATSYFEENDIPSFLMDFQAVLRQVSKFPQAALHNLSRSVAAGSASV